MEQLPNEVVEIILTSPRLTCESILNFGSTSKHFYDLVHQSSFIWKKKYQQRYPQFFKLFNNRFNDWYTEMVYIHDLSYRTHQLLSAMSPRFYKQNELSESDFEEWFNLMHESERAYQYIVLDLLNILEDSSPIKSIKVVPVDTPGNKTFQYYAIKVLRFIRQKHLTKMWENFEQLPYEEQLLEKGATYIAQWCQPSSSFEWENISEQLDNLSNEVIMEVKIENPNHPLLKVPEEVLLKWKLYNLDENQWNVLECQQIMKCLISVMYVRNRFSGNNIAYYMPENSYINEVLSRKQGLPITLAVIFESVARRVGLKCEPYAFPSHFLLKFTEGKGKSNAESYYIDVFNHGNIIRKGGCPRNPHRFAENPHRNLETATPLQVVERMANNLELSCRQYTCLKTNLTALRSVLELIHVVNSQDLQTIISLARLYMMQGIDTKPLENFLMSEKFQCEVPEQAGRIVHMLRDYDLHRTHNFSEPITKPEPKVRPENLKYAVGMIMRHVGLNYDCIIYHWDITCEASFGWQKQVGIQNLKYGRIQPFYKVLVEDGAHCYAPQEHLIPTKSCDVHSIQEIGKHFSHFFETHYVPNAETEHEYAADAEVRYKFHQQQQFGYYEID